MRFTAVPKMIFRQLDRT